MRKFLLFSTLFISKIALSQVSDNFSDGNFTQDPIWQGDVSAYTINSSSQLQTTLSSVAQSVNLYTSNQLATNVKWEFALKLEFDPSSSNQARIYLIADQADFNNPLNGYFVQIGESGNTDSYDLYKQSGTTVSKIIDGAPKTRPLADLLFARIKVTRDQDGNWELFTDTNGGTNYTSEGTVNDNTFTSTAYFGVRSIYTRTRSNLFYYDDFSISELVPDVTPPILNSVSTTDGVHILLNFNENVDAVDAVIANHYSLNPANAAINNVSVNGDAVTLTLANQLSTGNYTVDVSSIKDLKGNTASAQSKSFFYRKPYIAKANDIVINELFPDPSPQVDLPSVEFVELWNRTNEDIGLAGFKYSDTSSIATFGNDSIKANSYLILCAKADTAEFKQYGKVIGLSPWPSLNNTGDQIQLQNQNGELIAQVAYSNTWYKDELKKAGGWSLELMDPLSVCKASQNYSASVSSTGGTPGKENSIYLSNQTSAPLTLVSATLKDSLNIILNFNRGLDSLNASLPNHYSINNGVGVPSRVLPLAPLFSSVQLTYSSALARNKTYTVSVDELSDCGIGVLNNQSTNFVYPGYTNRNDVLINEILFNPKSDGVDFVEVYNNSDKILDFKNLKIAAVNDQDSVIQIKNISTQTLLFQPKTLWVITTNPDTVKAQYFTSHPENFIQLASLPSYSDASGRVVILNKDSLRIDQFNYNQDMHFALLKDVEGVSLERSSFKLPTNQPGNFRSATASVGYATPADKNSQYLEDVVSKDEISLASPTFSPDQDGFEDVLQILFKLPQANYVANVTIFDDQGRLIKKLIQNETLATEGEWIWDGIDQNNNKVKTGIYIIYAELFDLDGQVKKYKKTAVAATKFE
ncbi:MAG: lamin tail domain-containing protein [Sphingobacteriales bacterium]|nr:lamin tail domain-containing protein [Sphingobacteriales bacterium]